MKNSRLELRAVAKQIVAIERHKASLGPVVNTKAEVYLARHVLLLLTENEKLRKKLK